MDMAFGILARTLKGICHAGKDRGHAGKRKSLKNMVELIPTCRDDLLNHGKDFDGGADPDVSRRPLESWKGF